ncbi:hypothetical protein TRICI_004447 [Trichomonascus ciferrii]|uniref:Anaphase-promoting complex subunit 4 WD40 domain-containing protein n=1 Tax=Trichomonascus ciferrii TaxID=44093 RepID=A0A642V5W6_9ASCO|nr:hypothetical protein TRICI_004447 [Trichomonascus ciferrii]
MAKKSVEINDPKSEDAAAVVAKKQPASLSNAPTFRVITGSYEHNLLCVSLALVRGSEVFNPIFHFTPHSQSIRCLASTKRYLVSGSNDEHIRIYDLQKRKELGTLLHHSGSITCLSFFASKWLLSGAGDGKLCLWRVKDWEVLSEMKGHKGEINDVSIHPTGKIALSVGNDKTIRLWNMMTGKKASVLKVRQEPLKIQWTPEGTHFVVAFDRSLAIYSAESSDVVQEETFKSPLHHMEILKLGSEDDDVYVARSHSDGKIVFSKLSALSEGDTEQTFELVGHASRVKQFNLFYHQQTENYYLASVSSDGKLVVWDMALRDQVAVYNTGDRLNCCLCVPEEVEKTETMKKRAHPGDENMSEPDDTDYSESEAEVLPKKKKNKKNKKSKVSVELE